MKPFLNVFRSWASADVSVAVKMGVDIIAITSQTVVGFLGGNSSKGKTKQRLTDT